MYNLSKDQLKVLMSSVDYELRCINEQLNDRTLKGIIDRDLLARRQEELHRVKTEVIQSATKVAGAGFAAQLRQGRPGS